MNAFTKHRITLARTRVLPYASDPNFAAILITGSVAEDKTDDTSDIDIILYYHAPLTETEFSRTCEAAKATGGGVHGGTAAEGFAVYEYIDGVRVDLGFNALEEIETIITSVVMATSTDLTQQLIVGGILKSIPLHGDALIQTWKDRLTVYPVALGAAMVKTYCRFSPRWVVKKMIVDRGETLWLREMCLSAAQNLVAALCGLNSLYHPGKWKGISYTISHMQHKPERLQERLEGLFSAPIAAAAAELDALIRETFALIEQHMAHVDLKERKQFYLIERVR
jgi:hypothetical protein